MQQAQQFAPPRSNQQLRRYKPIWSSGRFQFTVAGAVLSLAKQRVTLFDYGVGDALQNAGYLAAYGTATNAETNLNARGERENSGSIYRIDGIAVCLGEIFEPELAKLVWQNSYLEVTTNGGNSRHSLLGKPGRIPGAGGLVGSAASKILLPGLQNSERFTNSMTNGVATSQNFIKLKEPIYWDKLTEPDSKFQIRWEIARALTFTMPAARVLAAGIAAYDPPAANGDLGTFCDVVVYLDGVEVSSRSGQV